jgi:hypothetical protein
VFAWQISRRELYKKLALESGQTKGASLKRNQHAEVPTSVKSKADPAEPIKTSLVYRDYELVETADIGTKGFLSTAGKDAVD